VAERRRRLAGDDGGVLKDDRQARGHRDDIDGLRAVAILPVLFFHAGFWPFRAGYVGVDIFFVISGYLITGLILREHDGAGFSLANFYDRRIRRILPALYAMLLAASAAVLFILLPDELELFGKSLVGAVLFYANILYWLRETAYFAPGAAQKVLVHVWSLSVEEQFYLFWPLLLIFLTRFRGAVPWLVAAMGAVSLALWLGFAQSDPDAVFYLLPTRAWQLLAGAFLACGVLPRLGNAFARNAVSILGLIAIAAAIVMAHRTANAVLAVAGTAAILYAADGGANVASAILATRAPVFIGRISYSLYLWHWPPLMLAQICLGHELTPPEAGGILAAAFVLAVLSWRFVEQPVRLWRAEWRGMPTSFPLAALGGAMLIAIALIFVVGQGLPARVSADVGIVDTEGAAPLPGRWCDVKDDCVAGNPAFVGEAVLWGDSHARALAPGMDEFVASRHLRLRQYTQPGCPPLPGLDLIRMGHDAAAAARCRTFNDTALRLILRSDKVRLVVLEARWEIILNENRLRGAGAAARLSRSIDRVLAALTAAGKPVLIVGNVPPFPSDPANCYGHARRFGRDTSACMILSKTAAAARIGETDEIVSRLARNRPLVRAYLPATILCDRAGCHAFSAGRVLYGDKHHLSRRGATLVGADMAARLRGWP